MRSSSKELKARARRLLSGNYGTCSGAFLLVFAVLFGIMFAVFFAMEISVLSSLSSGGSMPNAGLLVGFILFYLVMIVVINLMGIGLCRMLLNLSKGNEYGLGDILFAFSHHPFKFIGMMFLIMLISLIPGIPYIIVAIAGYATGYIPIMIGLEVAMYFLWLICSVYISLRIGMSMLILVDEPQIRCLDAIRMSDDMMKGHKGRLFYLYLSFTGMLLLSMATFYIGFLWTGPYMLTTLIQFYLERREYLVSPVYTPFEEMEGYQTPYDSVNYQ